MRKIVSLSLVINFILLLISSIVLYIVPEGRVAYWSDWTFWGLSKSQWGDIHITTGLLFLILGVWHTIYNWKPIINYIKKGIPKAKLNLTPTILAILINILVVVGTLCNWQPMKQILIWNDQIKEYQAEINGNPPYGHAELSSLESFCGLLGLNKEIVLKSLKEKQLKGDLNFQTTILDLAKANSITPQQVFDLIKEVSQGQVIDLPTSPPQGLGQMPLAQLCANYNIELSSILQGLQERNISADENQSLKQIADENEMTPRDIYEIIREIKNVTK